MRREKIPSAGRPRRPFVVRFSRCLSRGSLYNNRITPPGPLVNLLLRNKKRKRKERKSRCAKSNGGGIKYIFTNDPSVSSRFFQRPVVSLSAFLKWKINILSKLFLSSPFKRALHDISHARVITVRKRHFEMRNYYRYYSRWCGEGELRTSFVRISGGVAI